MSDPASRLSTFLSELKRRRVFRVAVVYAGVAFIVFQIVDATFEPLHLPDWLSTAVVVLLLLGFPIAVGLAWAFDITGKGVVRTVAEETVGDKVPAPTGTVSRPKPRIFNLPTSILGVVVLATLGYFFLIAPRLEGGEPIPTAVVDFVNETDEPELNGLSGMLITALEQSRRLAVCTRSRMFDILKQLGKSNVDHIDETLGREIARQAHLEALVIASIRKFGQLYTIDLKVLDPRKDTYLFTAKEEGTGQESIPAMLDRLAAKTRKGLKERTRDIEAQAPQVAAVTTPNLEAYQHYFKGEEYINKLKFDEAVQEFEAAVRLDSTFALAYYRLAYAISWNLGSEQLAIGTIQKAFALIDRVPDKIKYLLRAEKAQVEEGMEAGLAVLREMEQVYPDDKEMIYNIGDWSYHIREYATAAKYLEKTLALDPAFERALQHLVWTLREMEQYEKMFTVAQRYVDDVGSNEAYSLLGEAYTRTGDLDTGLKTLQAARERDPNNYQIARTLADVYIFQERYDRAKAELETLIAGHQPLAARRLGYLELASLYPYTGEYREAIRACDQLLELYWQSGDTANAATQQLGKSLLLMGGWNDLEKAWQEARKTFMYRDRIVPSLPYWAALAQLAVWRGDYALADSIAGFRPVTWWYPYIQVAIHARKQACDEAESFADTALQTAPGFIKIANLGRMAECQLQAGQLDKAAESLLKLQAVYDDGYGTRALLYPRSFYLLGKIYEQKGDRKLALEHYEKFLDLWKDADEDLPDLIDARVRYERLKAAMGS